MTTTMTQPTHEEVLAAFDLVSHALHAVPGTKQFEATFIPEDAPYPSVDLWDVRYFRATDKKAATKLSRIYGKDILGKRMIYVYVAGRGWPYK